MMRANAIEEPARQVPVYGEYDVVVLGGGPAGITAVVAAARAGRRTLLIERYGFLGGMGTAAGVTNFCGLHANVFGEMHRVVRGIASDLLARIDRLGGLNAPHLILGKILAQAYDTAAYKIAADDLLAHHKVDILFHALGAGVVMDGARIRALMVETKAGRQAVLASIFIDCSGDGDLAVWAGAPFEVGDNAGSMLYPSMMFRLNGIDPAKAGTRGGAFQSGWRRRKLPARTNSRARPRSCGRRNRRSSGGSTSPSSHGATAARSRASIPTT